MGDYFIIICVCEKKAVPLPIEIIPYTKTYVHND